MKTIIAIFDSWQSTMIAALGWMLITYRAVAIIWPVDRGIAICTAFATVCLVVETLNRARKTYRERRAWAR